MQRLTYTNFAILPMVAAVRFSQRLRQGRHELSDSEITVPPPPVNLTLAGLLALESYALRVVNMPLGSSLLALAVKRDTNDRHSTLKASRRSGRPDLSDL